MTRPSTFTRVVAAVLELAERGGPEALTMEGIAAAAGVGKQTLYRGWPSVEAILFDALAVESGNVEATEDRVDTFDLLHAMTVELSTEPRASLLRKLTAAIQTDERIATEFHTRLFEPQREQIVRHVAASGFSDPSEATELLLAPPHLALASSTTAAHRARIASPHRQRSPASVALRGRGPKA